jgi:hypothetical protein
MRHVLVPLLCLGPLAAEDVRQPDPAAAAEARATSDHDAWSLSPLVVHGPDAADTDPVGPSGQPLWTARRRFAETRTYVVPEGAVEVEAWYQLEQMRHGEPRATELIYELEIGLPWRCQIDVFEVKRKEGPDGSLDIDESGFELDHALADWNVIPGNPTLHGEYAVVGDGDDRVELALLLGGAIGPRLYWGSNLRWEQETGGERTRGYEITAAVSGVAVDRISVGAEGIIGWENEHGDRDHYEREALLGPSIQFRPTARVHMTGEVLAGVGDDSPIARWVGIVGIDF